MKKLILILTALFVSMVSHTDSYEDEVRKRLGLLKDIPVVAMPGMESGDDAALEGRSGEAVYNQGCAACHTAGLAGAPMLGSQVQWEERLDKGLELLTGNAYNGYNAMPAKGLCIDCSKEEIRASVDYMLEALTVD